jgi:hypothetical protein
MSGDGCSADGGSFGEGMSAGGDSSGYGEAIHAPVRKTLMINGAPVIDQSHEFVMASVMPPSFKVKKKSDAQD